MTDYATVGELTGLDWTLPLRFDRQGDKLILALSIETSMDVSTLDEQEAKIMLAKVFVQSLLVGMKSGDTWPFE